MFPSDMPAYGLVDLPADPQLPAMKFRQALVAAFPRSYEVWPPVTLGCSGASGPQTEVLLNVERRGMSFIERFLFFKVPDDDEEQA